MIFEVSESVIKTLRDASWSGSVTVQTHQRHLDNALTEFVGVNPDTFEFKIRVSQYLGVDPQEEIAKLFSYERNGTAVPLTIGTKAYGKYRWLITKHKTMFEYYNKDGGLASADITVSLTEYIKE